MFLLIWTLTRTAPSWSQIRWRKLVDVDVLILLPILLEIVELDVEVEVEEEEWEREEGGEECCLGISTALTLIDRGIEREERGLDREEEEEEEG